MSLSVGRVDWQCRKAEAQPQVRAAVEPCHVVVMRPVRLEQIPTRGAGVEECANVGLAHLTHVHKALDDVGHMAVAACVESGAAAAARELRQRQEREVLVVWRERRADDERRVDDAQLEPKGFAEPGRLLLLECLGKAVGGRTKRMQPAPQQGNVRPALLVDSFGGSLLTRIAAIEEVRTTRRTP